jgi:hypothetical protein
MNDEIKDSALGRALGSYSRSLRHVRPSASLDARIAASIQEHAGVRRVRPLWRRPLPWLVAASSVAVIATGVALLLSRSVPQSMPQAQAVEGLGQMPTATTDTGDRLALPSGQYSLWPTEAAVFRVKTRLGGAPDSMPGERQYWVDVRVANDGSMRIVRVLPANPEE